MLAKLKLSKEVKMKIKWNEMKSSEKWKSSEMKMK